MRIVLVVLAKNLNIVAEHKYFTLNFLLIRLGAVIKIIVLSAWANLFRALLTDEVIVFNYQIHKGFRTYGVV